MQGRAGRADGFDEQKVWDWCLFVQYYGVQSVGWVCSCSRKDLINLTLKFKPSWVFECWWLFQLKYCSSFRFQISNRKVSTENPTRTKMYPCPKHCFKRWPSRGLRIWTKTKVVLWCVGMAPSYSAIPDFEHWRWEAWQLTVLSTDIFTNTFLVS